MLLITTLNNEHASPSFFFERIFNFAHVLRSAPATAFVISGDRVKMSARKVLKNLLIALRTWSSSFMNQIHCHYNEHGSVVDRCFHFLSYFRDITYHNVIQISVSAYICLQGTTADTSWKDSKFGLEKTMSRSCERVC